MGRGNSGQTAGASLLYGSLGQRFRLPARFVDVSGLQLPSSSARPASGLDAWVIIGSLADHCHDDSAWEMFAHLANATMSIRAEHKDHKALSDDLRRAKVVTAFEQARAKDPGLAAWDLDVVQWDVCMRAVSLAHLAGGFEEASMEEIAATYRRLCGAEVTERGESVLCADCRQVISYGRKKSAVSGEAWRPGFGYCGYLCGSCVR